MAIRDHLANVVQDTSGATIIEYALIIACIGIVIISAANSLLGETGILWTYIQGALNLVW